MNTAHARLDGEPTKPPRPWDRPRHAPYYGLDSAAEGSDPLAVELGRRIRACRGWSWSQDRLAENLGVSQNTVSRIERGLQPVDVPLLCRIAAAFGLTSAELLEELEAAATPATQPRAG